MKPIRTVGDLQDVLAIYGRNMPIRITADGQPVSLATDMQISAAYFIDPAKAPRLEITLYSNMEKQQ